MRTTSELVAMTMAISDDHEAFAAFIEELSYDERDALMIYIHEVMDKVVSAWARFSELFSIFGFDIQVTSEQSDRKEADKFIELIYQFNRME